ncbi:hypothetical protein [Photobacterium leiognathi]|uniref:hypothetical protein n=1 Tax=Photobacterium leiognathi TaxID=553611 RepID=UPI00298205AA|nr:hypothetical protein [Photobacterium leiognathi]
MNELEIKADYSSISATLIMSNQIAGDVETEFQQNSLDQSVINHLYKLPFFDIKSSNNGTPRYIPTLGLVKKSMTATVSEAPLIRELNAERNGYTLEQACQIEYDVIKSLFHGMDKTLKTPIILVGLETVCSNALSKGLMPNAFPTAFSCHDSVVSFNVKNLQKYYGYPLAQAKIFNKNVREFVKVYPSNGKVKLAVPAVLTNQRVFYFRNVYMLPTSETLHYMWSYGQDGDKSIVSNEMDNPEYLEQLVKHEIPIPNLQAWKSIAKDYYENKHNADWMNLETHIQKRFIVNAIRHNFIGYNRAWVNTSKNKHVEFHAKAFDIILKKIIVQFPYLRSECVRQMTKRDQIDMLDY